MNVSYNKIMDTIKFLVQHDRQTCFVILCAYYIKILRGRVLVQVIEAQDCLMILEP